MLTENIKVQVYKFRKDKSYSQRRKWIPLETFITIDESVNTHLGEIEGIRYTDSNGKRHHDKFVKSWKSWDEDSETWRYARIGSGAYGDHVIWRRGHAK